MARRADPSLPRWAALLCLGLAAGDLLRLLEWPLWFAPASSWGTADRLSWQATAAAPGLVGGALALGAGLVGLMVALVLLAFPQPGRVLMVGWALLHLVGCSAPLAVLLLLLAAAPGWPAERATAG